MANDLRGQPAAESSAYHVARVRVVDTAGGLGTLAIDPRSRSLYGVGTKVLNIDRDSIVGSLPATVGHGYAFAEDLGRGVTRRGALFDLQTHDVVQRGEAVSARAVAYDRATRRAAIDFDTLQLLDVRTGEVAARLRIGSSKYVVSDGAGHFFVDLDTDTLLVIDARKAVVTRRWSLRPCESPVGMTVDSSSKRIIVSCLNEKVVILNMTTGKLVGVVSDCPPADQLAFDSKSRSLFVPTTRDTLVVIKEYGREQYRVAARIAVGPIHSAVAVDDIRHYVYLVHFGDGDDGKVIYLVTIEPIGAMSEH